MHATLTALALTGPTQGDNRGLVSAELAREAGGVFRAALVLGRDDGYEAAMQRGPSENVIGIAGLVALAACGGKVQFDAPGVGGGSAVSSCVSACASAFPDGKASFDVVSGQCACSGCSDSCDARVCEDHMLPTGACLPCVRAAIDGDPCQNHGGLFSHCLDPHDPCGEFVACITACR